MRWGRQKEVQVLEGRHLLALSLRSGKISGISRKQMEIQSGGQGRTSTGHRSAQAV